jgi:hypothetical protein
MTRRVLSRRTEGGAISAAFIDAWMERRIRRYGEPCLTRQEYRAVVYSLMGLPAVAIDRCGNALAVEQPTQRYIATKMRISQGRVSQLLSSAAMAMRWFELHGYSNVGWKRRGRYWHFEAPVRDAPLPREQAVKVRIYPDQAAGTYRLSFAGDA